MQYRYSGQSPASTDELFQPVSSTFKKQNMVTKDKTIAPEARLRSRGRPKLVSDESQRLLIVEGARQLFIEKGYGRTTTDDVAARCNISKQTLYRLFPGKSALFAAVVDAHRHSMLALPGDYDALPLEQALQQIFQIDIDPKLDAERMALLRLVMLEAQQYPELAEILWLYGADRSRAELAKWLTRQRDRGLIQFDDAESGARILMDMIFGALVLKSGEISTGSLNPKRRPHIQTCISIFLNGVKPR
ncbi:TetR/AcrR family transcriptional regulator [Rhodopseudomonas sp. P2A-2r]|uniref:TetR/AcrR family transcriptional regulator n=1 Tax=unclassified Rhodopseudomonas TaxID=2638247 RepID=UPI0022345634|nr:TetR/AcrR family transcriptional regulator [Rhodopseudomonas sp. P2A-2r]UZE49924.1 TetR/AcrR family transcriptional regulator [Rhodopseudomonas sp. P2A-2r]